MNIVQLSQLSTSSCETIYEVDGVKLRLWIIVGGTPALSLIDYTFSQRYPIKDKRWIDYDNNLRCYPHQNCKHPQGPTFDVLPEGEETIKKFLSDKLPLQELRMKRWNALPIRDKVVSKRIHDIDNHTFVTFGTELGYYHLPCVTASSNAYCGRCEEEIQRLAPEWFKRFASYINPIHDKKMWTGWEGLTEDEYNQIVTLLQEYVDSQK